MQEAEFSRLYRYLKLMENPMADITHGDSKAYGKAHCWHLSRKFQSLLTKNPMADITLGDSKAYGKAHGWHHSRKFQSLLMENPMADITLGNSKVYGKSHGWHHSRKFQSLLTENPIADITLRTATGRMGLVCDSISLWGGGMGSLECRSSAPATASRGRQQIKYANICQNMNSICINMQQKNAKICTMQFEVW